MVAVQAIDEIANPRKVIQRIYADERLDGLPSAVTKHFSDLFLGASDPYALDQVNGISQPLFGFMLIVRVAPVIRCISSPGILHTWHGGALPRHDPGHLVSKRNVSCELQRR
jgi:hypothetical protein